MEEISKIKELLSDKMRRVTSGKLYKIKNKEGKIIPYIPNEHQLDFYKNKLKYPLIIIPKARQLGFSTAEQVWMFDDFLFSRNMNCGIIADTLEIAKEIFRDKIRLLRDNLPDFLVLGGKEIPFKNNRKINTERSDELSIENTGSRISVGTSYRGGTLQRLHISEFGKICNKYPEKAREIVTGALQTVAIGQQITIESTAMGGEGFFYEFCMRAKEIQDANREPNTLEYKLLFYPRHLENGYSIEANVKIPQEIKTYFQELQEKHNIELSLEQENWYTMKSFELGDNMYREYPSTFEEAFNQTLKGSYFEREITTARKMGRICRVPYDAQLQVHTAWDLGGAGGGDDTAIWFFQKYGQEIRMIDFREGNGRSLIEILETIIKGKPYQYGKFIGPHDMRVTEYSTGKDRRTVAKENGFPFDIVPRNNISEGINAIRQIFGRMYFDEENCSKALTMLGKYTRAWDEKNGVFRDQPLHNGTSHCADALRYLANREHLINPVQQQAEVFTPNRGIDE